MFDGRASASEALPGILLRILHRGFDYARVRLELLELELVEERERIGAIVAQGVTVSLSALLTVQFAALLVVAATWDTPWRLHTIAGLLLAGLCATVAARRVLQRLRQPPGRPIAAALRDLDSSAPSRAVSDPCNGRC